MIDDSIYVEDIIKGNYLAATIFKLEPLSVWNKIVAELELDPTKKFYNRDDLIRDNKIEIQKIINSNRIKLENIIAALLPNTYLDVHTSLMKLATLSYGKNGVDVSDYHSFVIDFMQTIENKHARFLEKHFFENHCSSWEEVEEKLGYKLSDIDGIHAKILADYFFGDTVNNLAVYLKSFEEFKENFQNLISTEFNKNLEQLIDILTLITSFEENIDISTFKDIYHTFKGIGTNYKHLIYDCYHNAKLTCAEEYKKAITPLSEFMCKEKDGVKIYRAGEKIYRCFISCLKDAKRTSANEITPERFSDFISASFVSTNSLYSFKNLNNTLTLGYFDIDPTLMVHAYPRDSYTVGRVNNQLSFVSPNRIEFLTPHQMLEKMAENETYSEFCFASSKTSENTSETQNYGYKNMQPSCVFCLNEPTELEIEFAKKHELPIFVANTKNYTYTGEHGMFHGDKFTRVY